MSVEVATEPLIGIDILIDPLRADTWFAIGFLVTIDLFGAPIFAEAFFQFQSKSQPKYGCAKYQIVALWPADALVLVDTRADLCCASTHD